MADRAGAFRAALILYPIAIFPLSLQWLVMMMPMARIMMMMPGCCLYSGAPALIEFAYIAACALVIPCTGNMKFDRSEQRFAEAI
jgi:ABC-type polysaccharide/polyol phosphate export permease